MLRIGEAARRAGVTPATVRRWETQGLISPVRTAGGERRYREEDIDQLLSGHEERPVTRPSNAQSSHSHPEDEPDDDLPDDDDTEPATLSPGSIVESWDRRIQEARADLEVRKLLREQERLDREDRAFLDAETAEKRTQEEEAQRLKEQAKVAKETARWLQTIKSYGEGFVTMENPPPELRAKAARDLESFVTTEKFPPSLSLINAIYLVRGRVEKSLGRWKAERASSEIREKLLSYGRHQARMFTANWDSTEASRAMSALERVFREAKVTDWTRDDMLEYVENYLDAF